MPNWVCNEVDIHASLDQVQPFLTVDYDMDDPTKPVNRFNLHKLYPERFASGDPCGYLAWNYDWMVKNTGSKWNPTIHASEENGVTFLGFDSAWSPMNELLERMHQVTGWTIHNEFEEECPQFEGSFHCEDGDCTEDLRPGRPRCSSCEERLAEDDREDDWGECRSCAQNRNMAPAEDEE